MATSITQLQPLNLNTTANYTVGTLSATGNITGSYVIGNGSQLTGLPAGYANADAAAYLASGNNTSNIVTTGNISGSFLLGNGSQITGVSTKAYATGMSLVFGG